jgi:hypothetical protein
MGKTPITVQLIYTFNGKEIVEDYQSLLSCATRYQLSIPSLKNIINGNNSKRRGLLPDNVIIRMGDPTIFFVPSDHLWHCDLCDVDMKKNSRSLHLLSIKHRQKIVGETL